MELGPKTFSERLCRAWQTHTPCVYVGWANGRLEPRVTAGPRLSPWVRRECGLLGEEPGRTWGGGWRVPTAALTSGPTPAPSASSLGPQKTAQ